MTKCEAHIHFYFLENIKYQHLFVRMLYNMHCNTLNSSLFSLQESGESANTWFREIYEEGWNYYIWMGNDKEWFLGINKEGNMKRGHKTKKKQKSVKFVPRSATPTY